LATAARRLRDLFLRTGYVRRYHPSVRRKVGSERYKKGFEVRLTLHSLREARAVAGWLRQVGLKPGRAYSKHGKVIQPVYGRAALEWFLNALPRNPRRRGFTARGDRIERRPR
jgi:hypothetical protein